MEPEEIQEFSNKLKESAEGGESLTKISLAISILAVLVAMVTVLGHRSHTEAVLQQARATDQWNEYQAQKIRSSQLGVAADLLSLQPNANQAAVEAKLQAYAAQQKKYADSNKDESEKARDFETDVTHAERQAERYDLGEALLQISVVLCSVTLFTRKKLYFFMGLSLGAAGLIFAASALLVAK
jgi:hypothetical protein